MYKEMYKVIQGLSPLHVNEKFVLRQNNKELRGDKFVEIQRVKSVRCDTKSTSFLTLELLPNKLKRFRESRNSERIFKNICFSRLIL